MDVISFIHETGWQDLPGRVRNQARRCLLDTLGAAIGGRSTRLSQIIYDFSAAVYGGSGARLWLDGRAVSPPGAALAHGMTIDALDIHDGHNLTKGHAGAALVPALLATTFLNEKQVPDGKELLTSLVVGYEVALRAGITLHATACDYHTSGAWNALGCAAVTARRLSMNWEKTAHALGIAEYHGPRSQMMRCIDYPTMVKDGSGWGAMAGVSASLLARGGFTGAPAITITAEESEPFWEDLGRRWLIDEQYFKPYAICRWAQPAVVGALKVLKEYNVEPASISRIQVESFHEAVRLACRRPRSTEEAQYSLPFPVAAALVHRRLGPAELSGEGLTDPLVLRLAGLVELVEDPRYSARFPKERLARVTIETNDGQHYQSGQVEPDWDAGDPPADATLLEKFRWLALTALSEERTSKLETLIWNFSELEEPSELIEHLVAPPEEVSF